MASHRRIKGIFTIVLRNSSLSIQWNRLYRIPLIITSWLLIAHPNYAQSVSPSKIIHLDSLESGKFIACSATSQGTIYLVDAQNHRIINLDPDGKLRDTRGRFGWEDEQFDLPADITVVQNLDIYIADYYNSRLQHFDRTLNFLRVIPLSLDDVTTSIYPKSVDQAPDGRILVLDTENGQLIEIQHQQSIPQVSGAFTEIGHILQESSKLRISPRNRTWLVRSKSDQITILDRFASVIRNLKSPLIAHPVSVTFLPGLSLVLNKDKGVTVVRDNYQDIFRVTTPVTRGGTAVDITSSGTDIIILTADPPTLQVFKFQSQLKN